MIVLDTDVFTLLSRSTTRNQYPSLIEKIEQLDSTIVVTAITVEEVMRGALALVRKEETAGKGTEGARLLVFLLNQLSQYSILSYTDEASHIYRGFSPAIKRNGSGDCKIAAIAILHGATIITRNVRHFSVIPGVAYDDWTTEKAED